MTKRPDGAGDAILCYKARQEKAMKQTCVPDRKERAYYAERDIFMHYHKNADQIVMRTKDGEVQAAVYFFAPGMHELEIKQFMRVLRERLDSDL